MMEGMNYPVPFGKYLLLERINVGGMAEVFKAKSFGVDGFERILAIKRILPNMIDDAEFINMFVDEARIAVQLSHNNIVQIYELGKFNQQYYIAMEYVSGKDLRQILERYRKKNQILPVAAAAYIVSRIAEGLDYAHRKADPTGRPLNVIHRDVSPQNILVGYSGDIKITDFGIAKAEDRVSKTQAGVLKGKFGYMSPEQVRGLDIDRRSDVFAAGILLYEVATGTRLFVGESDFATLEKVRHVEITPPRQVNPDLPEAFEAILMKALSGDRDTRYQWGSEFAEDLQQFLIQDNAIFTAKKFAEILRVEFAEEIEAERKRMEEFMKLPAPTSAEALEGARQMMNAPSAAKTGPIDWGEGEKTMIFESSSVQADGQSTRIEMAPSHSIPSARGAERSVASANVAASRPAPMDHAKTGGGSVSKTLGGPRAVTQDNGAVGKARDDLRGRRVLWRSVGIGVVVVMVLAAVYGLVLRSSRYGTLVITTEPTTQVEVYLDNKLIASKTPVTRDNVALGEHTLEVKSPGFKDKAFSFELVGSTPAVIPIQLEIMGAGSAVPTSPVWGSLEVNTLPLGASVRIGGLPRGITPLTMTALDVRAPIVLQIMKDGFQSETVTVVYAPGELSKVVSTNLRPIGQETGDQTAQPGQENTGPVGTLSVQSIPAQAQIIVDGVVRGLTPLDIPGLSMSATHTVVLQKDGFMEFSKDVLLERPDVPTPLMVQLHPRSGHDVAIAQGQQAPPQAGLAGTTAQANNQPQRINQLVADATGSSQRGGSSASVLDQAMTNQPAVSARPSAPAPAPKPTVSTTLPKKADSAKSSTPASKPAPGAATAATTPSADKPVKAAAPSGGGGGCSGSGGFISVMAQGAADCTVKVGSTDLGVAPFFKKASPTGTCSVQIKCPDGKKFSQSITIKADEAAKLVVKATDWQ